MEQKDLKHIVDQFEIQGNVTEVKPLGNGLINTTYKVCTEGDAPDYVLQHVNNAIFPDVKMLMDNIVAVTGHIRKKLEAANTPDIDRKVLTFVPAKDGQFFYLHEGKYWRIMVFIPDTVSQTAVTPETSYIVGETFGNFQAMLADIPVQLGETIKDFHNMEFRMQQLREAVAENKAGRLAEVQWLVDELEKRAEDMCKAERLHREGKLPKRICHCDTKVDNILFDDGARKYIKGIAYQWAGQNCIARTHESWPEIELIQSESECGTGDNSWEYAEYIFHLINHYFRNGATAYTYWNMILDDQDSTWGWWQNSLFTITADKHEVRRNPEYYVMRHFSHYVRPGAKVLGTTGHFNSMAIAFRNPDGTVVVVAQNALDEERPFEFADPDAAERGFKVTLAPRSFNTFVLD